MGSLDHPLHIKQTIAFIDERPEDVVIMRRTRTATTAGGWKYGAPTALPVQRMRKVASALRGAVTRRTTEDGRQVIPTYTMIGLPDADIQEFDVFTLHPGTDKEESYEVVFVSREPNWRTSAEVTEHA